MIEIEKVCVDFSAGRGPSTRAVDDVSLRIGAGEIFGIVGTSGAGKSTLLRTLNALTRPSEGKREGERRRNFCAGRGHLRKARQRIGMIFQHFNLMHTRTVAQNVAFSLKAAGWERSKIGPRVSEILGAGGSVRQGEPLSGSAQRWAKAACGYCPRDCQSSGCAAV